jgi:ComF family protein
VCGDQILSVGERPDASPCCGECLQSPPPFEKAVAYGSYDGALRELIHLLKYDRVRPAASVLGRMVSDCVVQLVSQFESEIPVVVPVPLHQKKLRERGFNQSELIAQEAMKLLPLGRMDCSVLSRVRATETQTGLTPEQRRANIRGAFRVLISDKISGKNILLIDDVFTTGTTASECARVLRKAGAKRVWVATVARVLLRQETGMPAPRSETDETDSPEPLAMAARA